MVTGVLLYFSALNTGGMATNECPVCGADNPTTSITVNNSESQYYTGKGISEQDIVFDISFPDGDDVSSTTICDECYSNGDHLK